VVNNFTTQNGGSGGGGGWGGGWGGGGGCFMMCPEAPTTVQAYKTEVGKLKTWWNNRLNFFEQEINRMNIDVSKDIPDNPPPLSADARLKLPNGSSVAAVKNGINLNAASSASIKVFALNGSVIRAQQFARGNHSVRFGDLPRGMYMVRVSIDGHKQVLRVPVR